MTTALVTSVLAPLYAGPDHRTELSSEAPLGHFLDVLEERGPFLKVRGDDEHVAWVHQGHLLMDAEPVMAAWREEAHATSLGAALSLGGRERMLLPLGARLILERDGSVRLPDGRVAQVASGRVAADATLQEEARSISAALWAEVFFAGAPYRWGGVTTWGVDCSGLVQAVFGVRGVPLPRNSAEQAVVGEAVGEKEVVAGDLLCFGERSTVSGEGRRRLVRDASTSGRITHVAIADGEGYVVHASAAAGGVCRSPLGGGSAESAELREAFVGARRVERLPAVGVPADRRG